MNLEAYISSGILEAYTLGQLSEEERANVERTILEHPEVAVELSRIEVTLETLAFNSALTPPSAIKENVLREIAEKEVRTIPGKKSQEWLKYVAAASILLAIVSSFLAYNYRIGWKQAEKELADVLVQNQILAENITKASQEVDVFKDELAIINSGSYERVLLKGVKEPSGSEAIVYWSPGTKKIYLTARNFINLSAKKQFQLWAIVKGKPVDAGVFDFNESLNLIEMKNLDAEPTAFAITIEPRGGSQNPTLESMVVLGEV